MVEGAVHALAPITLRERAAGPSGLLCLSPSATFSSRSSIWGERCDQVSPEVQYKLSVSGQFPGPLLLLEREAGLESPHFLLI